jgi:hypothetical protein
MRPTVVALLWLLPAAAAAAATPVGGIKHFDRAGISFIYASDWFVTTKPLSNGADPDYRFAVASWPVRRTSRDHGPCLAGIARQRPPSGALVFVREYIGASRKRALPRLQAKPRHFRLPTQRDRDGFLGRGTTTHSFKQADRAFILWISVGPKVTDETRAALRIVLSSLRIRPRR